MTEAARGSRQPPRSPVRSRPSPPHPDHRRKSRAGRLFGGTLAAALVFGGIALAVWVIAGRTPPETLVSPPPVTQPVAVNYSPNPTVTATAIPASVPVPSPTAVQSLQTFPTLDPAIDLSASASLPTPMPTMVPTLTPTPATTPTATSPSLQDHVPPTDQHLSLKQHMLALVNKARAEAAIGSVTLGTNPAAQLHAESMLGNCFSSHWGIDGLKPHMRYSLAGGYQSNGENITGLDYCYTIGDRVRGIEAMELEVEEAMRRWMSSPGHRRNILDPWHLQVNIGLAWNTYNVFMVQHFEGNYVEYDNLPSFDERGVLSLAGRVKNGPNFSGPEDLGIQIYYDPPPHPLSRGQLSRTYCYDAGVKVAALREPLTGGWYYDSDMFTSEYEPCGNPYDVPADAPPPQSADEAHTLWQTARAGSYGGSVKSIRVPWVTADELRASGQSFDVTANLKGALTKHGPGVYTVMLWGPMEGENVVISQYSIFYDG